MNELAAFVDFMEQEFTLVSEKGKKGLTLSAEDSSKADQYATPNSSNSFFMFLSRVTLGSPFHTQTAHKNHRRPPERQDKNCLFDSLVGKLPSMRYREFIVYDRSQCYPEFLIEYKRM